MIEARGKPDLTISYTLTPAGGGTDLASDFDFRPTGLRRLCARENDVPSAVCPVRLTDVEPQVIPVAAGANRKSRSKRSGSPVRIPAVVSAARSNGRRPASPSLALRF